MQINFATINEQLLRVDFEQNWNGKLFCDRFNQLTLFAPEYRFNAKVEVMFDNKSFGIAKIEDVRHLPFNKLRDLVSFLNICRPLHFQAELLNRTHGDGDILAPDTMLTHIVLSYTDRNMDNQNIAMEKWWASQQKKSL